MVDVPLRHRGRSRRPTPAADRHSRLGWPLAIVALIIVGVFALGGLLRIAIDAYQARMTLTGLSDDPRPIALSIDDEHLAVPANMIRFAGTRRGGPVDQIDLALHWPALEGYSARLAEAFKDGSPSAPIVYATIARRDTALDATARLDNVYARFFVGKPLPGPAGLVGRRLGEDSGYQGEIVYFLPDGPRPFVARCLAESTPEMPATCLRDVNLGTGLSLLYRFNRDLLADWRALDTGVLDLAVGFLRPAS
jgi:hypothetical protein